METLTLFYLIIIIAIILLAYTVGKYFSHPRRRLIKAKRNEEFYLLDEISEVNKKMELTYKGCLFSGEKHLGSAENRFQVVLIYIAADTPSELVGLTKADLYFLTEKIHLHYPDAQIEWKYPINQLLLKDARQNG